MKKKSKQSNKNDKTFILNKINLSVGRNYEMIKVLKNHNDIYYITKI